MTTFDPDTFLAERRAMLLTPSPERVVAFARKWSPEVYPSLKTKLDAGDTHFLWMVIHKMRATLLDIPPETVQESKNWLRRYGYNEGIL